MVRHDDDDDDDDDDDWANIVVVKEAVSKNEYISRQNVTTFSRPKFETVFPHTFSMY